MPVHTAEVTDLIARGYTVSCGMRTCNAIGHYLDSDGFNIYGRNAEGFDRSGYDRQGYDRSGNFMTDDNEPADDNCDSCLGCDDCPRGYDSYSRPDDDGLNLEYYSYVPRLKFRGERAPYYGMEIEVTTDYPRRLYSIARDLAGDLIWCKSDSSVDGAEVVTHPMSYDWAMANFPWHMLPAFKDQAEATTIASDNGIHVHVGRDGFSDSAHMYRWMKLWYRNPSDIQRIARRRSAQWGEFRPDHRESQREHVKFGKPGYDSCADGTLQRYSAINTTNDATLEVRVFASTLRPRRAKAALQLVAGSVEYTRQLTSEQVVKRHGWDWPAFMAWTAKDGRYPDLITENRVRR